MTRSKLQNFIQEQEAATSVEYAIMLGLIILACIAAIRTVGAETANTMVSNQQEITRAISQ